MYFVPGIDRLPAIVRLALLMFVVVAVSITLTLLCVEWVLRRDLELFTHEMVADELAEYASVYNRHGLESIRGMFDHEGHAIGHAAAVSRHGEVLYRNPKSWPPVPGWPQAEKGQEPGEIQSAPLDGNTRFFWAGRELGDGNVFWYGKTDAMERRFHADIFGQLWLAGLFVGVLSLIPIFWFAKEIAAPLREFTAQARKIAGGTSEGRLQAPRMVPELREFSRAFNEGLERIERLTHSLRFANDQLAHELRTPLARLRSRIENAGVTDAAAGVIAEIERINRLLQTILDVRAGEDGLLFLHREPSDLGELASSLVDLYLPSADACGIRLSFGGDSPCPVEIDRQRVSQAVSNLLDNALRHTPPGGTIRVTVRRQARMGEINVADSGRGLPEGVDIWDRRAREHFPQVSPTGLGLGLSLVRVVAESHGGWASVEASTGRGASFSIWLPLAEG